MFDTEGVEEVNDLLDCIAGSRIDLVNEKITQETWYQELQDRLITLQANIPQEIKQLIHEINEINNEILHHTSMQIYRRAFIDGAQLSYIMTPKKTPKRHLKRHLSYV